MIELHRINPENDRIYPEQIQPGDFWWYVREDGTRHIFYHCPRSQRGAHCGVPVKEGANLTGKHWGWDGNEDKPTLTPSIHCHACGWHGFITSGQTREV